MTLKCISWITLGRSCYNVDGCRKMDNIGSNTIMHTVKNWNWTHILLRLDWIIIVDKYPKRYEYISRKVWWWILWNDPIGLGLSYINKKAVYFRFNIKSYLMILARKTNFDSKMWLILFLGDSFFGWFLFWWFFFWWFFFYLILSNGCFKKFQSLIHVHQNMMKLFSFLPHIKDILFFR